MKTRMMFTFCVLFFLCMTQGNFYPHVQAQNVSGLFGLWVTEIGGSDGMLFREDGTGILIRQSQSMPFHYEIHSNYLLQRYDAFESEELYRITNTGEIVILEYISDGLSVALINRNLNNLPEVQITNQDVIGTWYSWTEMKTYHFDEDNTLDSSTFTDSNTANYELTNSTLTSSLLVNEMEIIWFDGNYLVFNTSPITVWSRQQGTVSSVNISDLYGIWRGVVSNWTGPDGRINDLSHNYYEFRSDGTATLSMPLNGVIPYNVTDSVLTLESYATIPNGMALNIKYLDSNVLVLEEFAEQPNVKIVAYRVAPEVTEIDISGNLEGSWIGQNRVTVYPDGSTNSGQQMEIIDQTLIVTDNFGTLIQDVYRLDEFFLVLELQAGDTSIYPVFSRMRNDG